MWERSLAVSLTADASSSARAKWGPILGAGVSLRYPPAADFGTQTLTQNSEHLPDCDGKTDCSDPSCDDDPGCNPDSGCWITMNTLDTIYHRRFVAFGAVLQRMFLPSVATAAKAPYFVIMVLHGVK